MSDKKNQEKINSLKTYADKIRSALSGAVPEKHKNGEAGWRQFMQIDLEKTEAKIKQLQGL